MIRACPHATAGLALLLLSVAATAQGKPPLPTKPMWVERSLSAKPRAVRAALNSVMKNAGLSIDPEIEVEPGEIVTRWLRFKLEDFGPTVAHDTPEITETYPYVSPIYLHHGHYRLRARIVALEDRTGLALMAEIVADAVNCFTSEDVPVERLSNGIIEDVLYARLQSILPR